jgi:hypothetical protein
LYFCGIRQLPVAQAAINRLSDLLCALRMHGSAHLSLGQRSSVVLRGTPLGWIGSRGNFALVLQILIHDFGLYSNQNTPHGLTRPLMRVLFV